MSRFWQRILPQFLFVGVISLLIWAGTNAAAALVFLSLSMLVPLFWMLRNLSRIDTWLDSPTVESVPEGSGAWEAVFSRLRRLVRQRNQNLQELEVRLHDLQQAIAALPDAIVILDHGDHIEWCNPVAEDYFGLDCRRDLGQQVAYLIRQPMFVEYLAEHQADQPCILKLASERILSIQIIPYADNRKLLLARDITRIENVERMRRDFVANVSHELRTPLTVVNGFLETLSDMGATDAGLMKRSLDLMTGQTDRMKRLIEDLLTLSRLENVENQLSEEDVNVPSLLRQIHQDAISLSGKHHQIELHIDTEAGLRGNTEELRSGFGNLVSNAVRYTPEGGRIQLVWKMKPDGNAVFSVTDSGIGIESEHIPRLTERFYRVDRSRSRGTGGTGLGLAIVKHVLNRHQARLEVSSEFGKGSIFKAVFPSSRVIADMLETIR